MIDPSSLLVAVFLPIFPLSIVFNALLAKLNHPLLRVSLLLGWPLLGLALYHGLDVKPEPWLAPLALATAVFYAFRSLTMREVGLWTGYVATSIWACLWLPLMHGDNNTLLYSLWFSVPLAVLALLVGGLEKRYGAAYAGLYGGLAQSIPRFSGIFVVTVLAIVATPVFPSFFGMLSILAAAQPMMAVTMLCLWGLWSWAGMRLIQGMIVGDAAEQAVDDVPLAAAWGFTALMLALILSGFTLSGGL